MNKKGQSQFLIILLLVIALIYFSSNSFNLETLSWFQESLPEEIKTVQFQGETIVTNLKQEQSSGSQASSGKAEVSGGETLSFKTSASAPPSHEYSPKGQLEAISNEDLRIYDEIVFDIDSSFKVEQKQGRLYQKEASSQFIISLAQEGKTYQIYNAYLPVDRYNPIRLNDGKITEIKIIRDGSKFSVVDHSEQGNIKINLNEADVDLTKPVYFLYSLESVAEGGNYVSHKSSTNVNIKKISYTKTTITTEEMNGILTAEERGGRAIAEEIRSSVSSFFDIIKDLFRNIFGVFA